MSISSKISKNHLCLFDFLQMNWDDMQIGASRKPWASFSRYFWTSPSWIGEKKSQFSAKFFANQSFLEYFHKLIDDWEGKTSQIE